MNYHCKTDRLTKIFVCDLAAGHFGSEEYLPSELRLAGQYRVSRNTIRRMLDSLIVDGTLERDETRRVRINPKPQRPGNGETRQLTLAWAYAAYFDPMVSRVTAGIQAYAKEQQLGLQLITSEGSHDAVLSALDHAPRLGIDGVLVLSYRLDAYDEVIDRLLDAKIPVVTVGSSGKSRANSLTGDDFGGVCQALGRLIEKHYRPIYIFAAPADPADLVYSERYQAYALTMRNAGFGDLLKSHTCLILNGDAPRYWPMDQKLFRAAYQFKPFFDKMTFPASVFCHDDYMAHRLCQAAHENGLVVGRDLAVIGFDDLPLAQRLEPSLSTIRVDSRKLGYLAARLLHQSITSGFANPVHLKVPAEFIERASI